MSHRTYYHREGGFRLGGMMTPMVKRIIIACVVVFVVRLLASPVLFDPLFGLVPREIIRGKIWQFVTYIFLHGSFLHLLFNMLMLWMFGGQLEAQWGSRFFLKYFLICGVGAGVSTWILTSSSGIPLVGASGAIFGLLLAYGITWPNNIILLFMLFPLKAKHMVLLFAAIELAATWSHTPDGVGHLAHLGGMGVGYIYLRGPQLFLRWGRRIGGGRGPRSEKVLDINRARRVRRRAEIDEILDKISAKGVESLTASERRKLREAGDDDDRRDS